MLESEDTFLKKKNVYDLLVGYNAIDKSETLIIHKYSMVKNNVK